MSDEAVADVVTKKVGPLPGWAWVAIVAGGAWAYHLYKGRTSAATGPAPLSTDVSVAPSGFPTGTGNAGGFSGGGSGAVSGQPAGQPSAKSNAAWVKSVTDQMVAAGSDATAVSNALTAYVNGNQLDANGQSIINQAITHYGAPPEGTLPVKSAVSVPLVNRYVTYISYAGDPTLYGVTASGQEIGLTYGEWAALGFPKYTTAGAHNVGAANPNQAHIYVVKDGDTLESISRQFYGSSDTSKIRNANPGTPNPPGIGSVVYVP